MRKRGFTLIEALVTLALVLIMLGAIGTLMQMYANVVRHSGHKEVSLTAAYVAIDALTRDLTQAIRVVTPSSNNTSDTLVVQRIDPWNATRLPPTGPLPNNWKPHRNNDRMTVTYRLDSATDPADSVLIRLVEYPGSGSFEEPVCLGLNGLSITHNGNKTVGLTVTVMDAQATVYTVQSTVFLHTPARLYP